MSRGSPAVKLAISVDRHVHEQVIRAAQDDNVSVSAWMTSAARRALQIRDGLNAVAEWEAQNGAFTVAELAAARARVRKKHQRATGSRRSRVA